MAKSLEQILGYVNLTGVIQGTTTGLPDVFPPAFMSTKKPTIGDSGRYTRVTGTRKTARLAQYGSPARRRELKDISSQDVKLLHTFEEIMMDPLILQQLRNYDNYDVQQMGIQEVSRQIGEFRMYFENLRKAALASMLFEGAIWFDSSGNLLPSSSGAAVTVDFGMASGNQGQLDVFGDGAIIGASWATTSTDIMLHLRKIKKAARRKTGYQLKYAFYGENIPSYFAKNDTVKEYLARNPQKNQKFLDTNDMPDIAGLTWVPAYEAFFEDNDSTFQSFVGADDVVFTPEVSADWYELMEGTYMVPSSFNASGNMATALASMSQVRGMFSYAVPTHNPPTAQMFFGDTFLPILKVPNAIFQADVTP